MTLISSKNERVRREKVRKNEQNLFLPLAQRFICKQGASRRMSKGRFAKTRNQKRKNFMFLKFFRRICIERPLTNWGQETNEIIKILGLLKPSRHFNWNGICFCLIEKQLLRLSKTKSTNFKLRFLIMQTSFSQATNSVFSKRELCFLDSATQFSVNENFVFSTWELWFFVSWKPTLAHLKTNFLLKSIVIRWVKACTYGHFIWNKNPPRLNFPTETMRTFRECSYISTTDLWRIIPACTVHVQKTKDDRAQIEWMSLFDILRTARSGAYCGSETPSEPDEKRFRERTLCCCRFAFSDEIVLTFSPNCALHEWLKPCSKKRIWNLFSRKIVFAHHENCFWNWWKQNEKKNSTVAGRMRIQFACTEKHDEKIPSICQTCASFLAAKKTERNKNWIL